MSPIRVNCDAPGASTKSHNVIPWFLITVYSHFPKMPRFFYLLLASSVGGKVTQILKWFASRKLNRSLVIAIDRSFILSEKDKLIVIMAWDWHTPSVSFLTSPLAWTTVYTVPHLIYSKLNDCILKIRQWKIDEILSSCGPWSLPGCNQRIQHWNLWIKWDHCIVACAPHTTSAVLAHGFIHGSWSEAC